MTTKNRPYIAIIGGFYYMQDPVEISEAKRTAQEFGAALAKTGMGLVVYFSDDKSLEPHVVSGYVKEIPPGTGAGLIRVRFAESQKNQVKFAEQAIRGELFKGNLFGGYDWEAPFYRSLVEADGVDAVLLMAGGRSTLIAGQIALARPLPVLAIDKFGGSAGIIRTELATGKADYPSASTHTPIEMVEWLKNKCEEHLSIDPSKSQGGTSVGNSSSIGNEIRKIRIFLASSEELRGDRDDFEIYFRRLNDELIDQGLYLVVTRWENFLDAMSETRLQDEYNKAIKNCDIFVSLFSTKTGKFTEEEFDTAHQQFKNTGKPFIYTFFKDTTVNTNNIQENDLLSLMAFKKKLQNLGHFYTRFANTEDLMLRFHNQLDMLLDGPLKK